MFMGRVNGINQYKHGITRTYLNLDDESNCYIRADRGDYLRGDWEAELGKLEACLATLGAHLATPYDEEFIVQKQKALLEQGISLLTIEVEPQEIKIH
jgi:cob(I)alamin adenosyltransferase